MERSAKDATSDQRLEAASPYFDYDSVPKLRRAEEAEELATEEAPAMAPAAAVKPPLLVATDHPQVLVLVSDHASGTTEFGRALQTHPCVFDLEEPFSFSSMVWSTTKVHGCNASSFADAIFDADTGTIMKKANPVLSEQILGLSDTKKPGFQPVGLTGDDPSLYEGLSYDVAEYVVRIRDLVCKGVPANVCPPADCTITLKLFPQFVNANTAGQLVKERPPTKCMLARNEATMVAWEDALRSIAKNPKVAMMSLLRNEADRQFASFRQYSPAGTEFDCSLPRPLDMFQTFSKDHTDAQLQSEDCWEDSNKCLSEALKLVGLSAEPMGPEATELMAGVDLKESKDNDGGVRAVDKYLDPDSKSCSTNPTATFKRLENFGVQMLAPGGLSKLAAPHQVRGAQGWDATFGWDVPGWDANFVPSTPQVIFEEYEEPESTQTPLDFLDE
jgi:hypothetical protein